MLPGESGVPPAGPLKGGVLKSPQHVTLPLPPANVTSPALAGREYATGAVPPPPPAGAGGDDCPEPKMFAVPGTVSAAACRAGAPIAALTTGTKRSVSPARAAVAARERVIDRLSGSAGRGRVPRMRESLQLARCTVLWLLTKRQR